MSKQPFAARAVGFGAAGAMIQPASMEKRQMIVSILITFLVVVLVLWLVQRLPVDARVRQIAQIIVIVIGVVALLKYLAVF
jgi:hypothetical protein